MPHASEELRSSYEQHGFVVVPSAVDRGTIDAILLEYETLVARPAGVGDDDPGPRLALWRHVVGGRKRTVALRDAPVVSALIHGPTLIEIARTVVGDAELRLFEAVIFEKQRGESSHMAWHQDCAFYPFEPATQLTLWIALDPCTVRSGAVHFASGSHRGGRFSAVDLHTGAPHKGDVRAPYPDPETLGYKVSAAEMDAGGLVAFNVRTWHSSPPNTSDQLHRRALAVRFLVGPTRFAPIAGNSAGFIAQIDQAPGGLVEGPAFPRVGMQ